MKPAIFICCLVLLASCKDNSDRSRTALVASLELKRGALISCGPDDPSFGTVSFAVKGTAASNQSFALGLKLLHSFEYDEAEKVFAAIIDEDPSCAMAYWGVAMSNFHPLWAPPSQEELRKGAQAVQIAQSLEGVPPKEMAYVNAIAAFYKDHEKKKHRERCLNYEAAMKQLYQAYPDDREAAVLYALSVIAAADPADKTYARQKQAGALLQQLQPASPQHPGIVHYLIHAYDAPGLAQQALPAAQQYAGIAPSSAHALHMPSHIFTRLGHWAASIQSNLASVSAAQCYARQAGLQGHWDEELHGLDYLVYAYLQQGNIKLARQQWDYLQSMQKVTPANFKVAYAFGAIPARYVLENRLWEEAAALPVTTKFLGDGFEWQRANLHFARLIGAVHTNDLGGAERELHALKAIQNSLLDAGEGYKAGGVEVQAGAGEAWIRLAEGKKEAALSLMGAAADLEDRTEKHPVSPGPVLPARELLGDMLLQVGQYNEALQAYEASMVNNPRRFNSLFGAGQAAAKSGQVQQAASHYKALLEITGGRQTGRKEVAEAGKFLAALAHKN